MGYAKAECIALTQPLTSALLLILSASILMPVELPPQRKAFY